MLLRQCQTSVRRTFPSPLAAPSGMQSALIFCVVPPTTSVEANTSAARLSRSAPPCSTRSSPTRTSPRPSSWPTSARAAVVSTASYAADRVPPPCCSSINKNLFDSCGMLRGHACRSAAACMHHCSLLHNDRTVPRTNRLQRILLLQQRQSASGLIYITLLVLHVQLYYHA